MIKNLLKWLFSVWAITTAIWFSYWYILPIGNYWTNMINSYSQSYDIQITKNGTFLSQLGWLTKKVFVSWVNGSNPIYTFWTERWLPYVVFPSNWQWYYKWYYYCNTAVVPDRYPTTSNNACTSITIDLNNYEWTVEFFESFLSTLTTDDNVYYWNPANLSSSSNAFCIWNSSLWKSLCFQINYNVIDWNRTTRVLENLEMPESFNAIDSTKLFDPPGVWNWAGEETPSWTSSNNYFCPTVRQLMSNYWDNYNTWLCYNDTLYFDWTTMQTIERKSIFENFTDLQEYQNRVWIYNNNCRAPATIQTCQNAFNGEVEKYKIISNAVNNNATSTKLRQYCNLWLNYSPNTTTCVWSWIINVPDTPPTADEIANEIINWDYTILTPWTGTIFDNMNDWEEWTWVNYENIATRDVFGNITQIYDKITRIFEGRSWVNGILPDYILWLIFVILFFTVLMKK